MKSTGRRWVARDKKESRRLQGHVKGETQDEYQLSPSASAAQAAFDHPEALHPADVIALQSTIGNQAVQRLLAQVKTDTAQDSPASGGRIQRALTAEEKAQNLTSPRFQGVPKLEAAYDNSPPIALGDKGDAVTRIQQAFIEAGYPMPITVKKSGTPDGIFGRETQQTVKQFQAGYSLNQDGIVGHNTLRELDKMYGGTDIEATQKAIGGKVVEEVRIANDPNKPLGVGIWYDFEYKGRLENDGRMDLWNDDYASGYADPAFFDRIGWIDWRLKPGVSASEGIRAWLDGLTIAECYSALIAIQYKTVLDAVGDQKFDELFGGTANALPDAERLRIAADPSAAMPIKKYMVSTEAANKGDVGTMGNRPAKEGEWYYFTNHPKYLLKHPGGAFQGENAVYMGKDASGEQLWAGLGVPDTTEQGMLQAEAQAYNSERDEYDYESLVKYHTTSPIPIPAGKPDWKALYEANLDKIQPDYLPDSGVFPDQIDWTEILSEPEYEIDGTKRKGGFDVGAGQKLDESKISALRNN